MLETLESFKITKEEFETFFKGNEKKYMLLLARYEKMGTMVPILFEKGKELGMFLFSEEECKFGKEISDIIQNIGNTVVNLLNDSITFFERNEWIKLKIIIGEIEKEMNNFEKVIDSFSYFIYTKHKEIGFIELD